MKFIAWLHFNLIPFSIWGLALAAAGLYYDRVRTKTSRLVFALLVAGLLSTSALSAAAVYDMCKDPAWRDTWWWYAWGCYF